MKVHLGISPACMRMSRSSDAPSVVRLLLHNIELFFLDRDLFGSAHIAYLNGTSSGSGSWAVPFRLAPGTGKNPDKGFGVMGAA